MLKVKNNTSITRIKKLLIKISIGESPQFFNVLKEEVIVKA